MRGDFGRAYGVMCKRQKAGNLPVLSRVEFAKLDWKLYLPIGKDEVALCDIRDAADKQDGDGVMKDE